MDSRNTASTGSMDNTDSGCTANTGVRAVVVLALTRIIKSVVTGQAPVTLELMNTPGKKHEQTKGGNTHISHPFSIS